MSCGFESPEQISECIHLGRRWLQVVIDLAGLGTLALITLLVWLFRRLRRDVAKWENEAQNEKQLRHYAEQLARQAAQKSEIAEREAARERKIREELESSLEASESELRKELSLARSQLSLAEKRISSALESTSGGTSRFWSRPVGYRIADYDRLMASTIPILLFANQKGGVGKSTLVTNLAAAFAARGETVLTIDLDYQGSHSSLIQLELDEYHKQPESLIDLLFEDELHPCWSRMAIRKVTDKFFYIPAFYSFELVERRIEYRWALGVTDDDVRYRLSRALLAPEVQQSFDRVLIDAPPRFTLGFVNGFCSATHLYVPTVVDLLSASAVGSFARQFNELKPIVNPHIKWAGIIGTMTFINTRDQLQLPRSAEEAADAAEREAQLWLSTQEPLFIRKPVVKRDAELARATEKGIAYHREPKVRPMFDALASVIERRAPSLKKARRSRYEDTGDVREFASLR